MKQLIHIGFTGAAGAGKDEAAKILTGQFGYKRMAFGDIIKSQLDDLIQRHMGFSAFTQDRDQKTRIRRTLEMWGEDNYDNIVNEFFESAPWTTTPIVNTRVMRAKEAGGWKKKGGVIVMVVRPNNPPFSPFEELCLNEVRPFVDYTISNDGSVTLLHLAVKSILDEETRKRS